MKLHEWLAKLQPGNVVTRMLGGELPMMLRVTKITDDLIFCGDWTFDRATGAEVDEELGWGPQFGVTGSYLKPPIL
jgi:hypothetical protein